MVVIRFKRLGTKKTPHHRIVVTEQSRSQAGRVLEIVGYYDPSAEPEKFFIDNTRIEYWVAAGAKISEALQHKLKARTRKKTPAVK